MDTLKNLHTQNGNLVLSTDAKPRLKWTPHLHLRFVEAVNQLGGAEKATPKSLMRVMGIPGLTLYHLKSHLQKFRLGKSQPLLSQSHSQSQSQSQASIETKQEVLKEIQSRSHDLREGMAEGDNIPITGSFEIARALQMQLEVQIELHEQIEVQRRLQLRIEAQGRYLQSVLKKAQETLSGYNSSSVGTELAKAELSRSVSMANNGCQSSSISELTELGLPSIEVETTKVRSGRVCSVDSSLTSSESSGKNEDKQLKNGTETTKSSNITSIDRPLMYIQPRNHQPKKNMDTTDGLSVEQLPAKRSKTGDKLRIFDLNRQYQHDFEPSPKPIGLNCKGN